jgi:3D (Asp-Asp-Asp) domain-containing protein
MKRPVLLIEVWPRRRPCLFEGDLTRLEKKVSQVVVLLLLGALAVLFLGLASRLRADEPLGTYRVTAYCPCKVCCGAKARGITADGTRVKPGMLLVAARADVPFGTVLDIPGYGHAVVHDRGGAIRGKRLDVFFYVPDDDEKFTKSHQLALHWGVRNLEVRKE